MSRVARTSRLVLGILAGLAVAAVATGWLYLLRPVGLPGPQIGQALPLDALARRSGVSLLLFVAVWSAAGLGLGLIARAVRAERLTSALLLALGVGLWSYLQTGVSILIVQQVPAHEAFRTAAGLRSVYLPAALVGWPAR
jgi:hypothetical protein